MVILRTKDGTSNSQCQQFQQRVDWPLMIDERSTNVHVIRDRSHRTRGCGLMSVLRS